MRRRFNLWAFYLCLFCVVLSLNSMFSNFTPIWSVAPPVKIILFFSISAFVIGIFGFKYKTGWMAICRSLFTVVVSMVLSLFLLMIGMFFSEGYQLINKTHSPDNSYTINLYRTNGGATTSFGIKGVLNGPLWFKKTIYFQDRMAQADVEWKNNNTVSINNHLLNLKKGETYTN